MYNIIQRGVYMDIQMKKGLLDVCVLALLDRGDSYGYELVTELSKLVAVSESTLYPILKRLEAGGMLTTYTCEHGGRLRRYYRITQTGKGRLGQFEAEWAELQKVHDFITGGKK